MLYYGFNFGVEYRYAMPLNDKKEDKMDMNRPRFPHDASHGWVHGGWGECNVHCGGGKLTHSVLFQKKITQLSLK